MLKIILKRCPNTSPCEDHHGKQPGRQALTQTLTCLIDLVAQGEAGTLPCIVRGELDIERGARRDDGGRCYVPTVLAQQVCRFTVPISDLDVVIPVETGEMAVKPSVRETLQMPGTNTKHFFISAYFTEHLPDRYLGLCHSQHTTPSPVHFFPFVCLATFKSLPLWLLTSLIYHTHIHFNFRTNMQNLEHSLPPFPQHSFSMGEAQIQLFWSCSPSLTSLLKHNCAT